MESAPAAAAELEPAEIDELFTDVEAAGFLKVGLTRFHELRREPDFPAAVQLGRRGRRHIRRALVTYVLKRRQERA